MLTLRPSQIHGVGVFTTTPIRRGEDPNLFPMRDYEIVPRGSVRGDLWKHCVMLSRTEISRPREPHRMCIGWYLNHSATLNIDVRTRPFRALRYIRPGEELTIDYTVLEEGSDE